MGTHRIKYQKQEKCTGYIIQGSRKKGTPVHVNSTNKDVSEEK